MPSFVRRTQRNWKYWLPFGLVSEVKAELVMDMGVVVVLVVQTLCPPAIDKSGGLLL